MNELDFGKPALIKGYCKNWIVGDSLDFFSLGNELGNLNFQTTKTFNKDDQKDFTLNNYLEYVKTTEEIDPYYLTSFKGMSLFPNDPTLWPKPHFLNNYLDYLPEEVRPDLSWVYIGPKNSGSLLHLDVMNTSAWNALFYGIKRWLYVSPDTDLYNYDKKELFVALRESNFKFFDFPHIVLEQQANDLVYTPTGWKHMVVNVTPTIALTENFIDEHNIENVKVYCSQQGWNDWVLVLEKIQKIENGNN